MIITGCGTRGLRSAPRTAVDPAYWRWVEGRYGFFYPGYWARDSRFYGGIDYGTVHGRGYLGGSWENALF